MAKHSEQTKKKIGLANKGKKRSESFKKNLSERMKLTAYIYQKKIYQFDLQGNLIAEFISIQHAAKSLNIHASAISMCANDSANSAGGFQWSFIETKRSPLIIKFPKIIYQFDLQGNFIAEFISLTQAAQAVGSSRSSISKCANGKIKSVSGFKWSFNKKNN